MLAALLGSLTAATAIPNRPATDLVEGVPGLPPCAPGPDLVVPCGYFATTRSPPARPGRTAAWTVLFLLATRRSIRSHRAFSEEYDRAARQLSSEGYDVAPSPGARH